MKITLTIDDGSTVEFTPVVLPIVPEVQGTSLEDLQPEVAPVEVPTEPEPVVEAPAVAPIE